jgi:hypothetical protein
MFSKLHYLAQRSPRISVVILNFVYHKEFLLRFKFILFKFIIKMQLI